MTLAEVLTLVRTVLATPIGAKSAEAEPRQIPAAHLEVAVLDRTRPRRAFRRLAGPLLDELLTPAP